MRILEQLNRTIGHSTSRAVLAVFTIFVLVPIAFGQEPEDRSSQQPRALPQPSAAPIPWPGTYYSPRLRANFSIEPYGYYVTARLVTHPDYGSPLNQPQILLEAGDVIVRLDNMPLRNALQLEQHHSQTVVTFRNIRTGLLENRLVYLPPPWNGGPIPPWPQPRPYVLGVHVVPVQVNVGPPTMTVPVYPRIIVPSPSRVGLRITRVIPGSPAALAGLQPGETILTIGQSAATNLNVFRAEIARSNGLLPMTVMDAYNRVRTVTATFGGIGVPAAPGTPGPTGPGT